MGFFNSAIFSSFPQNVSHVDLSIQTAKMSAEKHLNKL